MNAFYSMYVTVIDEFGADLAGVPDVRLPVIPVVGDYVKFVDRDIKGSNFYHVKAIQRTISESRIDVKAHHISCIFKPLSGTDDICRKYK